MKSINAIAGVALALGTSLIAVKAQGQFDNVTIKPMYVSGNVYMLEGSGGNIGLSVGEDGLLMIDTQFAPLAEKIQAAMREIDMGKLEYVLNTHHHGDHTGGNGFFGKQATVVAHENVRGRLLGGSSDKEALPTITFNEQLSLHFNGEDVQVMHIGPGHTDGDSIIYFKTSNVLHMGDQFFNGRFPFIDLGSGGTVAGYAKNIEAVLAMIGDDVKIIPGHGPLASKADLQGLLDAIRETSEIVADHKKAGKSLEETQQAGLPEKYGDWSWGFINTSRWIQILYNGIE